jgi:hypothetical protein
VLPVILTVVSTAGAPPPEARRLCHATVAAQVLPPGVEVEHLYIDACEQKPRRLTHWENLLAMVGPLPPDRVVVSLDGDDWLGPTDALARVAEAHAAGAWVTWGQFVFADGRPGFAAPLSPAEFANVRSIPWVTTHLKTFRAGLFQRINPEHFKFRGDWMEHARDMALMYPCLEMAGFNRAQFIPETLYVYNYANATEFRGDLKMHAEEREQVAYVRGLAPYARIEAL